MKWVCLERDCHPLQEYLPGIVRCLSCQKRWYHLFIFNWDGWDR